jgi:hypothetical protein
VRNQKERKTMKNKERGPGEMGRRESYIDEDTGETVELLFCEGRNEPLELSRRAVDTDTKILPEPQRKLAVYLRDIEWACDICQENIATHVVGRRATVCSPCLERDPSLAWKMEADRREQQRAILEKYGYEGK